MRSLRMLAIAFVAAAFNYAAVDVNSLNVPIRAMHLMTASQGWVLAGNHILRTDTAGHAWADITPPLTSEQAIDSVYFLNANNGWAVLHGVSVAGPPSISTAATADGGKTWSVAVSPASQNLREAYGMAAYISFANEARGWLLLVMAGSSAFSGGDLFSTADGGKTWSALPNPPIAGPIQFLSDSTGWLVGGVQGDELYRTRDGGQTWVRKVMPIPDQVHPYVMRGNGGDYPAHPFYREPSFETPQKGLLAISVHVQDLSTDLLMYSTEDGGDTWQLQSVETGLHGIGPLAIFDSAVLEARRVDASIFLRRNASKASAISAPLPPGVPEKLGARKADFVDAQHGWLVLGQAYCSEPGCASTALLGTEDGGATLTALLKSTRAAPANGASPAGAPPPPIGGRTGMSGEGIDSCQDILPVYINSLYGPYGTELEANANYYTAYGFYLGGLEAVHQPSPNCYLADSSFILETACSGWLYLPIWDGYQAPCGTSSVKISTNLTTAASEGVGDADSTVNNLVQIGLSGSIAYLDIEKYPRPTAPGGSAACSQAVRTYVNAWISRMGQYGYYAGVYANGYNIADDMMPPAIANVPSDIWVAEWNGDDNTSPLEGIPSNAWVYTQRAHQYLGPTRLISTDTGYSWDLDAIDTTVAQMIDQPQNCLEGCKAACYNGTSGWCGSTCLNCTPCTCVDGKCTDCPIIIDPAGQGFHLTSLRDGVHFDLKIGEQATRVSWTDPAYKNAWLVLDRNGNGIIDDFTELFGNLTPQPDGRDRNGYRALAVFDDPRNGGNGNGRIDPGDAIYSQLRLWIDRNHNGFSEPDELYTLTEAGIFSIDLHYTESRYTDRFGNQFRYVSKITDKYGKDDPRCYDVYLQIEPIGQDN